MTVCALATERVAVRVTLRKPVSPSTTAVDVGASEIVGVLPLPAVVKVTSPPIVVPALLVATTRAW